MHKIAIMFSEERYDNCGDTYGSIVSSISEWVEVDDETYKILSKGQYESPRYQLLEQPLNIKDFIDTTVAGVVKRLKEKDEQRAKEEEKRKRKLAQQRAEKERNTQVDKIALLKKLQQEVGHLVDDKITQTTEVRNP